jgi:hypothetical protein
MSGEGWLRKGNSFEAPPLSPLVSAPKAHQYRRQRRLADKADAPHRKPWRHY